MANQEFELRYYQSRLRDWTRGRVKIHPYIPARREPPARSIDHASAWVGIDAILADLIEQFSIPTDRCLEFGVESGYSTAALSSYFDSVVGVDTFQGDQHTQNFTDIYVETAERLKQFENIRLIKSDYQNFITSDRPEAQASYGLIHVDIVHTYADTYACGLWSASHSHCTIFHDTESFPYVKQAVREIARVKGKKFYNFEECNGLGILV